jgi:hypothetical protein
MPCCAHESIIESLMPRFAARFDRSARLNLRAARQIALDAA